MKKDTRPDSSHGIKREKERIEKRAAARRRWMLIKCVLAAVGAAVFILLCVRGVSALSGNGGKTKKPAEQYEEPPSRNEETAVLTFAGDLCLAEDGFVLDYYDTVSGLSECISPEILEKTVKSDVFFLNHEYCIGESGEPLEGKYYTFRANPERMGILEEMGTDLVSLANNHVYDYGPEALLETADRLSQADIPYVGGGRNLEEAKRPVYFTVNGIKVGYVAAERAEKVRYTPEAAEDSPGVLLAYDTEQFNQVIAEASKKCDYLIAYIHWGTEDSDAFETEQHEMAEAFIDSGADAVIGSHPHVLQGIEYIDGKPVVYSLGDFWFNDETKYTGLLELEISAEGLKRMSFVPCLQTGYTTQYLKGPEEQKKLFDFLVNLSPALSIDDKGTITNFGK